MITDTDVTKLKRTFATKEDLDQVELNTGAGFLDVQRQFSEVRGDISDLKADVTELKADVKDIRLQLHGMERNIISAINEIKEDHEITKKRVSKLERVAFAN
jgi:chromosome segregation ATPase